ncbi:MAG: hypothetical protein EHM65_10730 [Acidobacteriales bacterium]|nr:MAG: hypothetical protein EHM65_10730 [Terriglobales bacterium]
MPVRFESLSLILRQHPAVLDSNQLVEFILLIGGQAGLGGDSGGGSSGSGLGGSDRRRCRCRCGRRCGCSRCWQRHTFGQRNSEFGLAA